MLQVPWAKAGLCVLAGLALASCDLFASLPVISAAPPAFDFDNPVKILNADITQRGARLAEPALAVSCEVSLRLGPGRSTPVTSVPAVQTAGNRWLCRLPDAFSRTVRRSQVLQFQWLVKSGTTNVADTGVIEELLDCDDPAGRMRAEQAAVVGLFADPDNITAAQLMGMGFLPTHGATSYDGMGVAFIRVADFVGDIQNVAQRTTAARGQLANLRGPALGTPDLLLMLPTGAGAAIEDVRGFDNPYQLIGWAYAKSIGPAEAQPLPPTGAPAGGDTNPVLRRPALRCVPHHEWFLHTAGFHRSDGTFSPRSSPLAASPEDVAARVAAPPPIFHPHLWDVHLFRSEDGIAKFGIVDPTPGAPGGIASPPNAFYYPRAYDG